MMTPVSPSAKRRAPRGPAASGPYPRSCLRFSLITASAATTAASSSTEVSSKCSQYSDRKADGEAARCRRARPPRRAAAAAGRSSSRRRAPRRAARSRRRRATGTSSSLRRRRLVARVEQHDRVDHEHHHRAHVDEHLEGGDEVHAEQAVDPAQEHHAGDERHRHAHRLAQHEHERARSRTRSRRRPTGAACRGWRAGRRSCAGSLRRARRRRRVGLGHVALRLPVEQLFLAEPHVAAVGGGQVRALPSPCGSRPRGRPRRTARRTRSASSRSRSAPGTSGARRRPGRSAASISITLAGHTVAHMLQAMHCGEPSGRCVRTCLPRLAGGVVASASPRGSRW